MRQMEARGIATDKGDLNRWIKATNALLKDLKRRIAALFGWLNEVREELSKPQTPALADLLGAYYGARNAGAWSNKGKVGNLQKFADTVSYLTEQKLFTIDDLEAARPAGTGGALPGAETHPRPDERHPPAGPAGQIQGRPRGGASAILYGPPQAERPLHAGGQAAPY